MGIASLNRATPSLPDLDCAIFRACDHPFSLAVECDARYVATMTLKCEEGVWVCGFNIVEFDRVMASRSEEAFIGRDAEAIDLRVRMLDRSRADARESLPKARQTLAGLQ